MKNVTTLVLGGGRGSRLYPLTKIRSKPAVPLAAKYRLIDIPLSNCINSGLNRIYVLTQFMSVSLHRHIRLTYSFDQFSGGFVELLAAQQTAEAGTDWYQGTADAVRKNVRYVEQPGTDYVLILSGDQLYRMDYREMLKTHQESGAEVTIGALPVGKENAAALGIMRVDDTGRVAGFLEKPQTDEELELVKMDSAWIDAQGIASDGRQYLASMGIYVFNRDFLVDVLKKTSYEDFGKEVFPAAFRSRHVQVHLFDGYWEDIGTIRAFYDANLSLASSDPPFELASPTAPVYSRARYLPPSRMAGAQIERSLIADGCRIGKGTVIENSVIGLRCIIGENVTIRDSIVMGADFYEMDDATRPCGPKHPVVGIGAGSVIEGAIIDKNCRIGNNVRVANDQGIEDGDDTGVCIIRDGIPVVMKDAELPDGWTMP
jgi:glucose-1-phosphate adenylyltransferase